MINQVSEWTWLSIHVFLFFDGHRWGCDKSIKKCNEGYDLEEKEEQLHHTTCYFRLCVWLGLFFVVTLVQKKKHLFQGFFRLLYISVTFTIHVCHFPVSIEKGKWWDTLWRDKSLSFFLKRWRVIGWLHHQSDDT